MAEELLVILNRKDPSCGLGFSLLGTPPGLPPIIYEIIENSPAAESGKVETGDVLLKVNETDVDRLNTKEVLRCLRLSDNPVCLRLKRDPVVKSRVQHYLATPHHLRGEMSLPELISNTGKLSVEPACFEKNAPPPPPPPPIHPLPVEDVTRTNGDSPNKVGTQPKFEAFVMTGDRVLKICRNQQGTAYQKNQRKVESVRNHIHNHSNHHHNLHHQRHNSVPTSPTETERDEKEKKPSSARGSPTPDGSFGGNVRGGGRSGNSGGATIPPSSSSYVVRTSRSEDHLQFNKSGGGGGCLSLSGEVSIYDDDDDDLTSSLNTLLDTRGDNGGVGEKEDQRIVWTYNAPHSHLITAASTPSSHSSSSSNHQQSHQPPSTSSSISSSSASSSASSSDNVSPHRSGSPASPTSVSSSVMSSNSSNSEKKHQESKLNPLQPTNAADLSQSEAVSNISSPDFQEEDSEIITRDLVMEVSDPSDSDSTLLVSETNKTRSNASVNHNGIKDIQNEHRIVIQVKGPEKQSDGYNRSNSPCRQQATRYPVKSVRDGELYNLEAQNAGFYQALREEDRKSGGVGTWEEGCGGPSTAEEDIDASLVALLTRGAADLAKSVSPPSPSPPGGGGSGSSEGEESDVESIHSFHYSPKGVDIPSAERLAKRLYTLDGFKKSDVSRHLSKNNEFSKAVAEEYLKYFSFEGDTLDTALRKFLSQFSLSGETQERERVLVHFSKRFLECNPGIFCSQDAVHTLTCAIMLLNTDIHGQNMGRKMTCNEFIDNLSELNDGENFPREMLKTLYQAIKNHPLEWALDEETEDQGILKPGTERENGGTVISSGKTFFDAPSTTPAIEYKKGYVMRKCCVEPNGKKTPLGKRGWKMYYCTLRDLVLYLHKDEHGFRKTQLSDNLHNAIRIHHSLATKATDYTKKLHVFRLETADQAVYLFQTSDSKELQSWIDTINFVCASFSSQPLPAAVGSQKKFQRPLLPSSHTKHNLRDQLRDYEALVQKLEAELDSHRKHPPERGAKQLTLYNFREKDNYLQYELKRYKTYAYLLRSRMSLLPDMVTEGCSLIESIGESLEECGGGSGGVGLGAGELGGSICATIPSGSASLPPALSSSISSSSPSPSPSSINRYSYRAAIYARETGPDIG